MRWGGVDQAAMRCPERRHPLPPLPLTLAVGCPPQFFPCFSGSRAMLMQRGMRPLEWASPAVGMRETPFVR